MTKHIHWDGNLSQEGFEIVKGEGGVIVCPTKVGYIIMTSDKKGLERKFEAKKRNRNKPGVVLCGSMEELRALAQLTPEIDAFYQKHWDEDILLGCILPWKAEAYEKLKAYGDGREELMTDIRGTSCFVIKFGVAGEQIAKEMWEKKAVWFMLPLLIHQVKGTAVKWKVLVNVSNPWLTLLLKLMIMSLLSSLIRQLKRAMSKVLWSQWLIKTAN